MGRKAATFLALAATATSASAVASTQVTTAASCMALSAPTVANATVVSMQAMQMINMPVAMANGSTMPLSFCDVNVTLTHGTVGDRVRVEVWLPLAVDWNGRFQGTGGSGFSAGLFAAALGPAIMDGYAAASTDAGLNLANFTGANTPLNRQLLNNFAMLSVHEMALVGKDLVQQFYGMPAAKSYFNGCSTGGRQGMMEAQRFPTDFDGVLAASPAINWDRLLPAELWPFSVMQQADEVVPACVLDALAGGVLAACDPLDGVTDGIVSNPGACTFDPTTLVGRGIACNATSTTITAAQASVFAKMLTGPTAPGRNQQLWYGLLPGTSPTALAGGSAPFVLGANWLGKFVLTLNPNASSSLSAQGINTVLATQQAFAAVFQQSQTLFDSIIGTDDPNLQRFQNAGGKLLSWHGLADQLVFPNGTFDYTQRVIDLMDQAAVDDFFRVFSAPGVQHCGGGAGAVPLDPLAALVAWVENGTAPDTLPARRTSVNGTTITRNLCRYPQMLVYNGGSVAGSDPNTAESWTCVPGPNQQVIAQQTASETTPPRLNVISGSAALHHYAAKAVAAASLPALLAFTALDRVKHFF
ncbi:Tannase/feruloyl esterase [Niveomyces insectorum RCEF 264]|uniref:Carboxylic ester hydrolase n=1 Tax=Niveomyces insectorum RCEF 264 TaxID=1081102 RepID=A0A167SST3_9HYPO|nr:Tannase/feruloyl esterase [Niveomyces insectorum RCEF 264]